MANAVERRERTGTRRQGGVPGDVPPISPAQRGMGYESTVDPWWWLDYQKYGTGAEQWGMSFEEQIRQFDALLAGDIERAELDYKRAIEVAQINAGATGAIAEANVRAAQIAAAEARFRSDTLMKIARLDNQTKLTIARETNKIEAMKWEATRFQHPSKWAEQEAWFAAGGAPAIETPTRSVVPQLPGPTPVGSAAGAQAAGWGTPAALDITAPQAVVGEAGPELATVTPQGVQVAPISQAQGAWLKRSGTPGMQGGGWLGGRAGTTGKTAGTGGRLTRPSYYPAAPARRTQTEMMLPGWQRQAAESRARMGQTRAIGGDAYGAGAAGGGAGAGAGAGGERPVVSIHQPLPGGAGGGTTTDPTRSVLSYLRGEEPMPSWGGQELGEYQIPGGPNYGTVPLPGQINLVDFLNLPYDMQQMYLSATEATYSMTPQTAMQGMTYFAPRGIAQPVAIWG